MRGSLGAHVRHPRLADVLDDEVLAIDVCALDRYEDVRVVATPVEQLGVELNVEIPRGHAVGVDDQVLDLADLFP
jgi:hypothetical protein